MACYVTAGTLVVLATIGALGPLPVFADVTGRASVIDGDTIEVNNRVVRLFGIDAPEGDQACEDADGKPYQCGQVAAFALDELIGSRIVECEDRTVDGHGRISAVCTTEGIDVASWLIRQGVALGWPNYIYGRYTSEQVEAQAAQRGMWSGMFVAPWEWRQSQRPEATASETKGSLFYFETARGR